MEVVRKPLDISVFFLSRRDIKKKQKNSVGDMRLYKIGPHQLKFISGTSFQSNQRWRLGVSMNASKSTTAHESYSPNCVDEMRDFAYRHSKELTQKTWEDRCNQKVWHVPY